MVTAENFPWEAEGCKNLQMAVPGLLGSGGLAFRGLRLFERNVRDPTNHVRLECS